MLLSDRRLAVVVSSLPAIVLVGLVACSSTHHIVVVEGDAGAEPTGTRQEGDSCSPTYNSCTAGLECGSDGHCVDPAKTYIACTSAQCDVADGASATSCTCSLTPSTAPFLSDGKSDYERACGKSKEKGISTTCCRSQYSCTCSYEYVACEVRSEGCLCTWKDYDALATPGDTPCETGTDYDTCCFDPQSDYPILGGRCYCGAGISCEAGETPVASCSAMAGKPQCNAEDKEKEVSQCRSGGAPACTPKPPPPPTTSSSSSSSSASGGPTIAGCPKSFVECTSSTDCACTGYCGRISSGNATKYCTLPCQTDADCAATPNWIGHGGCNTQTFTCTP